MVLSDCVKWLWQHGLRDTGLFMVEAPPERVAALMIRMEKVFVSFVWGLFVCLC